MSSDYERLMCAFRRLHAPSAATVIRPLPKVHIPQPEIKQRVVEKPRPTSKEEEEHSPIQNLFEPIITNLNQGRDAILRYIESEMRKNKKGIKLKAGAAGLDLNQNMKDVGETMEHFMRLCLNEDTLLQNNNTDPSTFLQEATDALSNVQKEYTQALDSFLNYNLGVGQNIEEDEEVQDVQLLELVVQTLFPVLAEQADVPFDEEAEKPSAFVPSAARFAAKRTRETSAPSPKGKEPEKKKVKTGESAVIETAKKMSVVMLQIALWSFRSLRFTLPNMTQFHSVIQNTPEYFRVLVDSVSPKAEKDQTIRVNKQRARAALQKLHKQDKDILDLRSEQLAESSTLWNYALRRFKDFLKDETANKLLPGFVGMILQSMSGQLIAVMNDATAARRATELAEEREQTQLSTLERMKTLEEKLQKLQEFQGPEAQVQKREFLFDLYMEVTKGELTAANFHSTLEKLRYLTVRNDAQEELLIFFDGWRVLLNRMLKLTYNDPEPFFDASARLSLQNADKVLNTDNLILYETHRDTLNELAISYGGELEPVTRATEGLSCVTRDSVCATVDADLQLPGAAEFLETNVKLLHRMFGIKQFQEFMKEHPDVDLWTASRDGATKIMLDVPGRMLDRLVAVKDLKDLPLTEARDALSQGDDNRIEALKTEHPEQFRIAAQKRISDAIHTATQERIANLSRPIPVGNLQREARSLNRDAAWEAIGNMLARGTHNTIINNLVLSILASVSRAFLGFHLMDLLRGSQQFLSNVLGETLGLLPRLAAASLQFGLARNMLSLAAVHGVVGATTVAEEWDAYLDEITNRRPQGVGQQLHTMYRWLLRGLRNSAEISLKFYGYINNHAMAGWIAFGVLLTFHGLSSAFWDVGVVGMGLAAARSALQSSNLIVLSGAEGALHHLLRRYMTRYMEQQKEAIKQARKRGGDLAAADQAQNRLYWSPTLWALGGSSISIAIAVARILLMQNFELWNGLFQADFRAPVTPAATSETQLLETWLQELELSLTGNQDYSGRYTFNEAIAVAVQAAAGKA